LSVWGVVWGSGFWVQGLGFRVLGSGFGVWGLGLGVSTSARHEVLDRKHFDLIPGSGIRD